MNKISLKKKVLFVVLLFFTIFYSFTVFKTYNVSQHILTDAAYYLMGAENLAQGNGFYAFNVGYLENIDIKDFKSLEPITRYQPMVSVAMAFFIKVFDVSVLQASRWVNLFFYAVFLVSWLFFYQKVLKNEFLFLISALFLIFTSGVFTYITPPHSEMLFMALLGIFANLILFWQQSEKENSQSIYTILLAIVSVLIVLTRYAGIGFIVGFGIAFLIILAKKPLKLIFFHLFIYGFTFFSGFGFWAYRNLNVAGSVTSKYPDNYFGTLFDFNRIVEILNYFTSFSLALPNKILAFSFLLLIPILFVLVFLFYKNKIKNNPVFTWLIVSVFVYVSMIIYVGVRNREVSLEGGFMRFFFLLQPFVVGILILSAEKLLEIRQFLVAKISLFFIGGLLFLSLVSGVNRTRIFFQTLPKEKENNAFFEQIKQKATRNDLILSNNWQDVSARTSLPIVQIHFQKDIDSLMTRYQNKFQKVYLILYKNVGVTYRQGVDTYTQLLDKKHFETIKEDSMIIFLQLESD